MGQDSYPSQGRDRDLYVSIQLVSPASGELTPIQNRGAAIAGIRFPFNWFPQRVGRVYDKAVKDRKTGFPFNWFPQRVGSSRILAAAIARFQMFPFNWFLQRVGRSN